MKSARHLSEDQSALVKKKVAELGPWFHNFQIADGIWTNPKGGPGGAQYPDSRWKLIEPLLPDVAGKTVLDFGCCAPAVSSRRSYLFGTE